MAHPDILDDVPALLARLTEAEKVGLVRGLDAGRTPPVERLGIPSIVVGGPAGSPCFPAAAGLASSWNPGLLRLVGDAVGRQARATGIDLLLHPWAVADPVLNGELGAAFVSGVQRHGVVAELGETGRPGEAGGPGEAGDLDTAAATVLRLVRRVVREAPPAGRAQDVPAGPVDLELQHALTRHVAHECAVLLKNEPGADRPPLLPLSMAATGSLAVIGEFARTPRFQAGGPRVRPARLDDALSELRHLAGPALRLQFAPGFVVGSGAQAPVAPDHHSAAELRAQAVEVARISDVVLLFLGLPADPPAGRGELPADQLDLLRAVAEVNSRVAVVLSNDAPVTVGEWAGHARSILECWLLGEAGGGATADLLFGVVNPSGKLAEAIPGHPFGHGLSYTTFGYDDLSVQVGPGGDAVDVGFTVTNTGRRLGQEVAQVYVLGPGDSRRLAAFAKVELHAEESTRVRLTLPLVHDGGRFVIGVGASSEDIRLTGRPGRAGDRITLPETDGPAPVEGGGGQPAGGPVPATPSAG